MIRLVTSLLALLLLASPALAQFSSIFSGAPGTATFNSNNQKVSQNRHGTVISYITSRNASYTAQGVAIDLISSSGAQISLLRETRAANAPCVETGSSGEIFAVISDWQTGTLTGLVWRDVSVSLIPERVEIYTPGSGKTSCVFDEARRVLYYLGTAGNLVKWQVDLATTAITQVWTASPNHAEYPSLSLGSDGVLHVFWNTVSAGSVSTGYRSVQHISSPDGGTWWSRSWLYSGRAPRFVTLPVIPDETGDSLTMTTGENHASTSFMMSSASIGDRLLTVMTRAPTADERCFWNNLRRCSAQLISMSRRSLVSELETLASTSIVLSRDIISPIMASDRVIRPGGGASIVSRGGRVHLVTTDASDVVLMRMDESSLVEVGRWPVPGASISRCAMQLSAARGGDADRYIVGTLTLLNDSCHNWTASPDNSSMTADVVMFRLTL